MNSMNNRVILKLWLLLFCFAATIAFGQNAPIRFAWLSDTHVGSPTGAEDLGEAVRDINNLETIDFVIISGDVTEMGSNEELGLARALLDRLRKPYYIIPGNHDTKWSESGCTTFPALWGSDKFHFEFSGYRFIGMHQGPLMRMGDGHFAPEDLRWLDSLLINLPNPAQPIIFITHYPIDNSVDNWYEFLDRAKKVQTRAILFGHGHRNKIYDLEGIPGMMGRSTLRRDQPHGGYNLVTIKNDSMFFYERVIQRKANDDEAKSSRPEDTSSMPQAWHKLSLQRWDFDFKSTEVNRPDFSVNQKYPQVRISWLFDTQYSMTASPCVWRDWVIVVNRAGTVYGLSVRSGKKLWTFQIKGSIFSSPAADEGKVVFAGTDGILYCLTVNDGRLVWQFAIGSPVVAAPQIHNGVIYIGASDGRFRAIRLKDGSLVWEFSGVAGFVETRPLIYQDKVIFGAWDTYLYALNQTNGSLAWKWSNGNPGRLYSPAACWPVAAEGKVFIVAPDRFITAIDASSGETVWRTGAHKVRESIGIAENGQTIYARCMEDTLLAFSARSDLPRLTWAMSCNYGYDIAPSMPIEKQGVVFFGTKNGFLYAVDTRTRTVTFQFRVGVTQINTVAPIDGHRVIVSDLDGNVMMIERHR